MALGLAAMVGACAAVTLALASVMPLILVVLTTVVLAHRLRFGWRLALAFAVLGAAVGQVLLAWLAPRLGWSLASETVVAWTLVGVGHAVLAARSVPAATRWTRRRAVDLGAALVVPAALGVYFWLSAARSGPWIAWAMANDAANYTIATRGLLADGGLLPAQGNAAPLPFVLHATWAAPGSGGLSPSELVRHLITSGAQLSLAGWGLLGFVAAVVALAGARGKPGTRILLAAAAAALPWTWFMAQISYNLGFTNAAPAMTVLVLGWCCWQQHAHHAVGSLTGQILATWAAAVTWGPLAIVPAAWIVATLLVERRGLRAAGRALLLPAVTFAGAAAYAVVFTIPDLSAQGDLLGGDGAAPPVVRTWALGVAVAVLLVSLLPRTGMSPTVRVGIWFGVPAAGLGAAYLIRARADMADWWGYYPAKFTWIALGVLFLLAVGSLHHPARRLARRGWQGNGVLLLVAVLLVAMSQVAPPGRPVTLASAFTPVHLHNPGYNDAAVPDLFDLMERDPKSIVARYSPVAGHDYFVNYWLLQMGAEDLNDPIRIHAYYLDSSDPAALCTAITDWRGGVTVWTRAPRLEKRLADACDPSLDYRVEVVPPPPDA